MSFIASRLRAGMTPRIKERALDAGEAGLKGALLFVNADGEYEECGADPELIAAVALSDFGTNSTGFGMAQHEFPPGYMQGVSVDGNQPFHAEYMGTLPEVTDGEYGVTRDTDLQWKVDFDKSGAEARVKLVSLDMADTTFSGRQRVEVRVLPAFAQLNQ